MAADPTAAAPAAPRTLLPGWAASFGPAVAIVVVQQVLFPGTSSDGGYLWGLVLQGLTLGLLTALVALGMALVYRANRIVNFAQGDLGLVPAALAVDLILFSGLHHVLALTVGLAAAVVVGGVVELAIIRRLGMARGADDAGTGAAPVGANGPATGGSGAAAAGDRAGGSASAAADPGGPEAPALGLIGLTRSFGGIRAVDDVTLAVGRREVLGVIGPNGAGKTTLFDLVSGFLPSDGGRVLLGGRDVTHLVADGRARAGLGRSFQDARLFPAMTVDQCIAVALERRATCATRSRPRCTCPRPTTPSWRCSSGSTSWSSSSASVRSAASSCTSCRPGRGASSTWRASWPTARR